MKLIPIGLIRTPFKHPQGTPIQPRAAVGALGKIEVFDPFVPGLKDLEGFERIWLLYWFDRATEPKLVTPTFLDETPHGLFSTRAPARPNPIGLSSVKLIKVDGGVLHVEEIDVLDKTPLLDIKPYAPEMDCFEVEHTGWIGRVWKGKRAEELVADDRFHREPEGE